jgi:anti-sigma factor ChrR (cupin superfamily)
MHDETGRHVRGDLILLDERESHSPRADEDLGCICLAVASAPVKLKGFIGSLINPFLSK